jgi:hypothetical protein
MAATVASYTDVMKQVWTADRIVKQFYDGNPLLERIEKTSRFHTGADARVPLHKGRSGGVSSKPAAGGALNPADGQRVDAAVYNYTHQYGQVEIESAAIDQTDGKSLAVANVIDTEVSGMVSDLRHNITRQLVSNGDALIAQFTTTSATTPLNLLNTGYGFDAIERGWLYPGLQVDIGSTSNEVVRADAHFITAVSEDATTPTVTVSTTNGGSAASLTTASTDYISVANARSGATSYETNGLRQIAGSASSAVGGLDPDTAGEEFWKPAHVDTTTTALTLDLLLLLQRKVHQKVGTAPSVVLTSLKQQAAWYALLQNQTRFTGETKLGAGKVDAVSWNGMIVEAQNDIPNRELYMLTFEDFFLVAPPGGPKWFSDQTGTSGLPWKQGYTSFVDGIAYRPNLAVRRRNGCAAATALTA